MNDQDPTPVDPYGELEVDPRADESAIRRAYHAKARLHHPDRGGDPAAMTRLNVAYEILSDRARRRRHDAARPRPARPGSGPPPWTGAAGPPPGKPSGPVLDFGLFAGWSIGEIARHDPGYLVWLSEHREGRPYLAAIERIIAPMREAARARTGEHATRRR
jgi:DnaJ family protein A protein 2